MSALYENRSATEMIERLIGLAESNVMAARHTADGGDRGTRDEVEHAEMFVRQAREHLADALQRIDRLLGQTDSDPDGGYCYYCDEPLSTGEAAFFDHVRVCAKPPTVASVETVLAIMKERAL